MELEGVFKILTGSVKVAWINMRKNRRKWDGQSFQKNYGRFSKKLTNYFFLYSCWYKFYII